MDVHEQLSRLRETVAHARSLPMSAAAVVNRDEVLAMVEELSGSLERSSADAGTVVAERDAVVAAGRREAEQVVADAYRERDKIVSDTDVFRVASREAEAHLARARSEAEALRRETDDYVDAKLANFEITLVRTTEAVARGRERLAGRSTFADIAPDAVEEITLPAHLEP